MSSLRLPLLTVLSAALVLTIGTSAKAQGWTPSIFYASCAAEPAVIPAGVGVSTVNEDVFCYGQTVVGISFHIISGTPNEDHETVIYPVNDNDPPLSGSFTPEPVNVHAGQPGGSSITVYYTNSVETADHTSVYRYNTNKVVIIITF